MEVEDDNEKCNDFWENESGILKSDYIEKKIILFFYLFCIIVTVAHWNYN